MTLEVTEEVTYGVNEEVRELDQQKIQLLFGFLPNMGVGGLSNINVSMHFFVPPYFLF